MKYIAITGPRKSGTTILAAMLHFHPQLYITNESNILNDFFDGEDNYWVADGSKHEDRQYKFVLRVAERLPLGIDTIPKFFHYALEGEKYFGDKIPGWDIGRLPKKIMKIILLRDPRSVLFSEVRDDIIPIDSLKKAMGDSTLANPCNFFLHLPEMREVENSIVIRHEDLCESSNEALRIADFLQIDGSPLMDFHQEGYNEAKTKEWMPKYPNIEDMLPSKVINIMREYGY